MQKNLSKKTAIFEIHLHHGARMVPFAGYSMPVSYKDGIIAEHLHTRAKAGHQFQGSIMFMGTEIFFALAHRLNFMRALLS